ncbi:MAG TPA: DUF2203 domain-containing protein [Candidatus Nanoarchaeia archaeon]|nr:DUF2203 domain-containing protein [Candidatus Nanoarchaeia archaeon]
MPRIYRTLEQAQQLIATVSPLMRDVMRLKRSLDELNTIEIEYDDEAQEEIDFISINKDFHRLNYQFYRKLELLEKQGCIVKDIDLGLIDFLSVFQGKEILLCWRFGEDAIDFYHEIDQGYQDRKPIKEIEERLSK